LVLASTQQHIGESQRSRTNLYLEMPRFWLRERNVEIKEQCFARFAIAMDTQGTHR
jgi:hypothetical protein